MNAPQIRPLAFDPAHLRGLSPKLIESHHRNNYAGAVRRLGAIRAQSAALDWSAAPAYQVNGLKREERIAAHSMTLHELYSASLGGDETLQTADEAPGRPTQPR